MDGGDNCAYHVESGTESASQQQSAENGEGECTLHSEAKSVFPCIITAIGLAALSENNPSLETLVMNSCFNITDTGILSAVKGLKRLKHLDIQGCRQLTDASLIAIGQHCQRLQYLNVNRCIEMTVGKVLEVEKKLETLRTLYFVGLKTDSSTERGENLGTTPAPPPPPRKKHSAR